MANKWFLALSGDTNDTNNWATTMDGAGGTGVPVDGDAVFFYKGVQNITAYDHSAIELLSLNFLGGFGYPAGQENPVFGLRVGDADGTPLKWDATTLNIDNMIYQNWYLHGEFTTVNVRNFAVGGNLYLQGAGVVTLNAGTNGTAHMAVNSPITTIESSGMGVKLGTSTSNPGLMCYLSQGAVVESRRQVLGGVIGGNLILRDEATVPASGNFTIANGGTMDCRQTGAIGASANDGTIRIEKGGTFTCERAKTNFTVNTRIKRHVGSGYRVPSTITVAGTIDDIGLVGVGM